YILDNIKRHNAIEGARTDSQDKAYKNKPYLYFLPGEIKYHMCITGKDGTGLFNKKNSVRTHYCVNSDLMLDACMVRLFI
ncbi:hypothetical protein F4703DRAFT_1708887, partial [Phycomyces blakesleeanus]